MHIFGKSYFSGSGSYTNSNSAVLALADIFNGFLNTLTILLQPKELRSRIWKA